MKGKKDATQRDATHNEFIEKWANFVKSNSQNVWKKEVSSFIDAQFQMAERFYKKLSETKEGREKIEKIKQLKMQNKND